MPRPQVQVISIGENDLRPQRFQQMLRHGLDRGRCAYRHEGGSLDHSMRQAHGARLAGPWLASILVSF